MKFLIVTLLLLAQAHANDLPATSNPFFTYKKVEIMEFKGAELNAKFIPQSNYGVSAYKGVLKIRLVVQGNICDNDPKTLGSFETATKKGTLIQFLTGLSTSTTPSGFCRMYGRNSEVVLERKINMNKFDAPGEAPVSETFLIEVPTIVNGNRGMSVKVLRVFEENGLLLLAL